MTTKPSPLVDARLHSEAPRACHRALGSGEPLRKVDFELRGLVRDRCHSGKDVTWQQSQSEPVRVVKNDRVVDRQIER